MQHIVTVVFLLESFSNHILCEAQSYSEGICTGSICALIGVGQIQCINDTGGGDWQESFNQTYTEPDGTTIGGWGDVAISPIDGTIYVLYNIAGVDKLGTITDPLNNATTTVTPIGELFQQQYTGMTFDCEGNLYGVTVLPRVGDAPAIYQFDITGTSDPIDSNSSIDDGIEKCNSGTDCIESLFYNFEHEIFYRISSHSSRTDRFYTNTTAPAGIAITTPDACTDSKQFFAAEYIGNERSIVSCDGTPNVLLLSGTPNAANIAVITGATLIGTAEGLFNYNNDGRICKAPSCTNAPTTTATTEAVTTTTPIATTTTSVITTTTTAEPTTTWKKICEDKCDAFTVNVLDYEYEEDLVCITYKVTRKFSTPRFCSKGVKFVMLGLCENDSVREKDISALIDSCQIINPTRRLGSRSSDRNKKDSPDSGSPNCWGDTKKRFKGVRANFKVDQEVEFRICLEDVFVDNLATFSNKVLFNRGRKFICEADHLDGLPCLDMNKFNNAAAMMNEDAETDTEQVSGLSGLSSTVRWTIISICILIGLLVCILGILFCVNISNKRMLDEKTLNNILENNVSNITDTCRTSQIKMNPSNQTKVINILPRISEVAMTEVGGQTEIEL